MKVSRAHITTCPSDWTWLSSWELFHELYCPLVPFIDITLKQCLHINLTFFHMQLSQLFTSVHQTYVDHGSAHNPARLEFSDIPTPFHEGCQLSAGQSTKTHSLRTHTRKYNLWEFHILCTSTVSEEGLRSPQRSLEKALNHDPVCEFWHIPRPWRENSLLLTSTGSQRLWYRTCLGRLPYSTCCNASWEISGHLYMQHDGGSVTPEGP